VLERRPEVGAEEPVVVGERGTARAVLEEARPDDVDERADDDEREQEQRGADERDAGDLEVDVVPQPTVDADSGPRLGGAPAAQLRART
jgi:hypothetical protein